MKVLIVEDEVIIALDLVHQLQSIGYDLISIVNSGEEALRAAKESKPDIVLMDIKIKGQFNGLYVARELNGIYHIPIIFVSAYSDPETEEMAEKNSPCCYIHKPFTSEELREAIDKVIA